MVWVVFGLFRVWVIRLQAEALFGGTVWVTVQICRPKVSRLLRLRMTLVRLLWLFVSRL